MTIDEIARGIAGGEPPQWLPPGVAGASEYLAKTIAAEAAWPSRARLRAQFSELAAAAETVRRLVADPHLRHLLRFGVVPQWPTEDGAAEYLAAIATRAKTEAAAIPPGGGRNLHAPPGDGLTAREICAAIVAVAWQAVRTGEVPHTQKGAQDMCGALWALAGGAAYRQANTGWRVELQAAKEAARAGRLGTIEDRLFAFCARRVST